jgi:integrase
MPTEPSIWKRIKGNRRRREQYSLHWNQVNLDRHQLHLSKTKTGKPRTIPLNATATKAFNSLKSASTKPIGLVFPSVRTGMSLQGPRGWFGTAVEAAGIKDFTWYCLRHTTASRLVMGGASLRAVADLLGHKTIQMTMRYAHLAPDHQTEIVALLDKKPSGARATKRATGTK